MTSGIKSPSGVKTKTYPYENFQGLDTSRDVTSLDTGKDQHLAGLVNATCDWRGQIVRDPACKYISGQQKVNHVAFYSKSEVCWAEEDGTATNLISDRGHEVMAAHPKGAIVSSTVFNQSVFLASRGRQMYRYDGIKFNVNQSPSLNALLPAYTVSVQRRLCVAGIPGKETEVHVSRVDQDEIWPEDEAKDEVSTLRAGFFDIANNLGTADQITGLGAFEQNRLVIFTADRALVYKIDPNIDQ